MWCFACSNVSKVYFSKLYFPNCIFPKCIYLGKVYFCLTVFFQTIFVKVYFRKCIFPNNVFQTVFSQRVFFPSVFFPSVFLHNCIWNIFSEGGLVGQRPFRAFPGLHPFFCERRLTYLGEVKKNWELWERFIKDNWHQRCM